MKAGSGCGAAFEFRRGFVLKSDFGKSETLLLSKMLSTQSLLSLKTEIGTVLLDVQYTH